MNLRNKAISLLHEVPSDSIANAFTPDNLKKPDKSLAMMKKSIKESQKVNSML